MSPKWIINYIATELKAYSHCTSNCFGLLTTLTKGLIKGLIEHWSYGILLTFNLIVLVDYSIVISDLLPASLKFNRGNQQKQLSCTLNILSWKTRDYF